MEWYLKVLRDWRDFDGRARRKEYWMFALFNLLISMVAVTIDNVVGLTLFDQAYGMSSMAYGLVLMIPSLAVAVRRLHDVGKSGWWIFINLIPIIGGIWFIILLVTEGNYGDNEYGHDPKEEMEEQY